jgi:hypothetical protein
VHRASNIRGGDLERLFENGASPALRVDDPQLPDQPKGRDEPMLCETSETYPGEKIRIWARGGGHCDGPRCSRSVLQSTAWRAGLG